jgi:hypothetical protein
MKTSTSTSKCQHVWVTCEGRTVCLWCPLEKVRDNKRPVQRLKIPRADPPRGFVKRR